MFNFARRAVYVLVLSFLLTGCLPKKGTAKKTESLPSSQSEVAFQTLWKADAGASAGKLKLNLAPTLVHLNGETFVAAADRKGNVSLTNATTGKNLWRTATKLPLSSAVGTSGDLILVGSQQADVVALDKATGEERWRTKVSSEVLSAPMGRSEGIAVLSIDSRLHGLDARSGNQQWLFDSQPPALKLRGGSSPLVFDTVALVGFASGQAGLFDLSTGRVIWLDTVAQPRGRTEIERIVDINGQMVRRGNTAYIVTYQGKLAALDLQELRVLWTRDASSYVGLDAGVNSVVVTDSQGKVQGVDRFSGETLWSQNLLVNRQPTAPLIVNDRVVLGDSEGRMYAFALETGEILGFRKLSGSGISAPPLLDNQDVIVQTKAGSLIKMSLQSRGS